MQVPHSWSPPASGRTWGFRSERMLMEQISYNMLFRWFVGLEMDDTAVAEAAYLQPSLLETRVAPGVSELRDYSDAAASRSNVLSRLSSFDAMK